MAVKTQEQESGNTMKNYYVTWNKSVSPLSVSPSAKCDCFPLSEVSPGSLVVIIAVMFCVFFLFFLIRNVSGTNHWQLFSLVGEILNGKEELVSKGV